MSSGCGDVLSLADLQTAKKHQIFEAEVITGKSGGVAGGADIDYATNQVTGQTQKTLPAVLRDAGFSPVSWDFSTGGTLTINDRDKAVLWPTSSGGDGNYYIWKGVLPKVVPASSAPSTTGGISSDAWVAVSEAALRDDLSQDSGSSLVGFTDGRSVQDNLSDVIAKAQFVTPEQFYNNHPGETDWAAMINEAYAYARSNNMSVLLANDYNISSSIIHYDGVNVLCTGRLIASPSGNYTFTTALGNTENAAYIITTENGVFNNAKSAAVVGLTLTHTTNREPSGYTDPHINSKGVVITDVANVYISNLQTFGFLDGGVDVGGISGNGFEIVIDKCLSWIYAWDDSEKIGFRCNVTDSTFRDVVTVAYGIGVHNVKGGGNVYFNAHPWGYPLTTTNSYPNRQCKIPFLLTGGGSTFFRPYADTVTKIDSSLSSSRANGGIGFYVENWRNKIIAGEALVHSDDINTNMSLVYLKGDSARNEIEFVNVTNPSKLIAERVSYDSGYQNALFTNLVRMPEYSSGNLSNLTGAISFDAIGVTSSGTYNLRRSGDHIDIGITITVSSVSSASGALSITLPRGLSCRFGPTVEPSQTSCFGNISSANIGVVAVLNGVNINFYYKTSNGSRTAITASGVSSGVLELHLTGRISN